MLTGNERFTTQERKVGFTSGLHVVVRASALGARPDDGPCLHRRAPTVDAVRPSRRSSAYKDNSDRVGMLARRHDAAREKKASSPDRRRARTRGNGVRA